MKTLLILFVLAFSLLIPADTVICATCFEPGGRCGDRFDCDLGCDCVKKNNEMYGVCF